MMPTPSDSVLNMHERFEQLKRIERAKYICPDYAMDSIAGWSNHTHDDRAALVLRLKRVLSIREQALHGLYDLANNLRVDRAIMSASAFIFDRYLSTIIPNYVKGQADLPYMFDVIGVASLAIAAKSQLANYELAPIEEFLRFSPFRKDIIHVELEILVELNWNITYPSPNLIIRDLLALLPCQYGQQESVDALEAFKESILNETAYLPWTSAATYGCATKPNKFPLTTIALAPLMIAFEKQYLVPNKSSNLVCPVAQFNNLVKACQLLDLSSGDEE